MLPVSALLSLVVVAATVATTGDRSRAACIAAAERALGALAAAADQPITYDNADIHDTVPHPSGDPPARIPLHYRSRTLPSIPDVRGSASIAVGRDRARPGVIRGAAFGGGKVDMP